MNYYLGCPMWSNKAWVGKFFGRDTKAAGYLKQYARTLSSVEGNTTIYALPKRELAQKWRDATPAHFRFTFKFPKVISHDLALQECGRELDQFLAALTPLHDRLGTLFLQLPHTFTNIDRLARFLSGLPREFHYAVEVRNRYFFDGGHGEEDFVCLLREFQADRVIFDTHRLLTFETSDASILDAKKRKPKMPPRTLATGPAPFLRYVGRPDFREDTSVLDGWAAVTAAWIREGRTPYVFMHQAPDDDFAPEMCRLFHELLRGHLPELPQLPPFPCESDPPIAHQLSLF